MAFSGKSLITNEQARIIGREIGKALAEGLIDWVRSNAPLAIPGCVSSTPVEYFLNFFARAFAEASARVKDDRIFK